MSEKTLPTSFAPAERDSSQETRKQSAHLLAISLLRQLLDAVPEILLILNDKRQIVFANQRLLDVLDCEEPTSLTGMRFGEVLKCTHASETEGGCGTTEACQHCGAMLATLSSQKRIADVRECRIAPDEDGEARNFNVSTTPFELEGRQYTILCATDVSGEKSREVLQRVLFEGILGGAREMTDSAEELRGADVEELHLFREATSMFSSTLVEEINEHRILTAAERDELFIQPRSVNTRDMLKSVLAIFQDRKEATGRVLEIKPQASDSTLTTDPTLLKQILYSLVKNALEACEEHETVTLNADTRGEEVEFSVQNPNFIPRAAQLQIFQRGFTTKGQGRGVGTYGVKLLSEKYLKGTVSFVSTPNVGTAFRIRFPSDIG